MSTVDTLAPASTTTLSVFSVVGAATAHAALSDGSDTSYLRTTAVASWLGGFGNHALPANHARHTIKVSQLRIRAAFPSAMQWRATGTGGPTTATLNTGSPNEPFSDFASAAVQFAGDSFTASLPITGSVEWLSGLAFNNDVAELRVEIDSRARPTYTIAVLDGDGIAADPLILSNVPTLAFNAIALDGLAARFWRAALYDLATTLLPGFSPFDATWLAQAAWNAGSVAGAAPATIVTTALPNGDYVIYTEISSTVGVDTAHPSAVVSDGFEVAVPIPDPPTVVATVVGQTVEVCVTDNSDPGEWDDTIVVTIRRHDAANPDGLIVAVSEEIEPEGEWCWTDCFTPLCAPVCFDESGCEAHEFYYTATLTGLLGGYEVTTDPGTSSVVTVPSPGYHRVVSADCEVTVACLDDWGSWVRVRPHQVWRPAVGGLPYVTVGDVGGRDWSIRFAVTQADLTALETLLADPVFYWSPPFGAGSWLAPLTEAVTVQTAAGSAVVAVTCVEVARSV